MAMANGRVNKSRKSCNKRWSRSKFFSRDGLGRGPPTHGVSLFSTCYFFYHKQEQQHQLQKQHLLQFQTGYHLKAFQIVFLLLHYKYL